MHLGNTFGALFIGLVATTLLCGVVSSLTYLYFTHYPNDKPRLKIFVSCLWPLGLAQLALLTHSLWSYLVANFDHPLNLERGTATLYTSLLFGLILSVLSKCYHVHRIAKVWANRSQLVRWSLVGASLFFLAAQLALRLVTVADLFKHRTLSRLSTIKFTQTLPYGIVSVVCDAVLVVGITKPLSDMGFGRARSPMGTALLYSINRLLLLFMVDIVAVIVSSTSPHDLWFLALNTFASQLAVISVLACLNTRPSLQGQGVDEECISRLKKPTIRWRHSLISGTPSRPTSSADPWMQEKASEPEREQPSALGVYPEEGPEVIEISVEKARTIDLESFQADHPRSLLTPIHEE